MPTSCLASTPNRAADPTSGLSTLGERLEAADWEARLLARLLPDLCRRSGELAPDARLAWMLGLRRAWNRHGWALAGDARKALLELAAAWSDWPLAVEIGSASRERGELDVGGARDLASALHHLGDSAAARTTLLPGLLSSPADARHAEAWRVITADQARDADWPVIDGAASDDPDLRLTPLGQRHLLDYAWQYHDPDIGARCNLPDFTDAGEWLAWLKATREQGDRVTLAVLHREWGFIGSVSLVLHDGIGFFYYWLGRDFQGHGLGPRAGVLLLGHAERHWGLRACYARVYADNAASRRGLAKLQFRELSLAIAGDGAEERLYRRAEQDVSEAEAASEARELFARMESRARVLYPRLADARRPICLKEGKR